MKKNKRTAKVFVPYNDYQDRPFGLKWGTAFALDELTQSIEKSKKAALKVVEALPQMTRSEMDALLQQAFLKSQTIAIQRNIRDKHDNLIDNVEGVFKGIADEHALYMGEETIEWETIRHIKIVK